MYWEKGEGELLICSTLKGKIKKDKKRKKSKSSKDRGDKSPKKGVIEMDDFERRASGRAAKRSVSYAEPKFDFEEEDEFLDDNDGVDGFYVEEEEEDDDYEQEEDDAGQPMNRQKRREAARKKKKKKVSNKGFG